MSARTYICLTCRWARRAMAAYGLNTAFRCPACRTSLWELDRRWRIPQKDDAPAWKVLEGKVAAAAAVIVPWRQKTGAARVAKLDQQIAALGKRRDFGSKATKLRKLHSLRKKTMARYA